MYVMNRLYILLTALFANIAMLSLVSCSDDDSTGLPVIECVRTTDPELSDSTFTDAVVGQMILIQGRNLNDARHIYINNQDVYFNSNYNTSTHIIVTIPSDLVVRGMDESLPLEIKVETSHGTATYGFHVIAGSPTLELYKADLPLNAEGIPEMVPGQEVTLVGTLLHEIEQICVTDLDTIPLFEITEYTLNAERTEIKLKMPLGETIPEYGIYMVKCYAGEAYCGFSKSPMEPEIYDVVPDMPVPGQKVVIYGKYLTNLTALKLCGEIDINIEEVVENDAMTALTFTMPAQLPTAESNGMASVSTLGGKATVPFYNYDWIFEDFDGNGSSMMWQWGTNNYWGNAPEGSVPVTSGNILFFDGSNTGWWNNEYVHGKAMPEGIPAATPLEKVQLRFEVYLQEDAALVSRVKLFDTVVERPVEDYNTGALMPGQWMSVVIPMTEYGPDCATWGDLSAKNNLDSDNFVIDHATKDAGAMHTGYDNFRFYIKDNNSK